MSHDLERSALLEQFPLAEAAATLKNKAMTDSQAIRDRLQKQRQRVAAAAAAAGRDPSSVGIIAVSKTHPVEAIVAAYESGQRDFGENYVQELKAKAEQLAHLSDLRWHFIGHLQSNKAKHVAPIAASVQSVSSAKLARHLAARVPSSRRPEAGPSNEEARGPSSPPLQVLVEVNVAGEASKSGCSPSELSAVLDAIDAEPRLRLRGLMTVPPFTDDPEAARPHFEALARLAREHDGETRLPELSMGMSHDAEVAVACGATWVRIGTAIFGARPPKE